MEITDTFVNPIKPPVKFRAVLIWTSVIVSDRPIMAI